MRTYTLSVGLVLRRGERFLDFKRLIEGGRHVVLEDQQTGAPQTMSVSQLTTDVLKGRLVIVPRNFVQPSAPAGQADPSAPRLFGSMESIAERYRQEMLIRQAFISAMRRAGLTKGMRAKIDAKLAQMRKNKAPPKVPRLTPMTGQVGEAFLEDAKVKCPSASALMTWWRELESKGDAVTGLVSGNASRKRRPLLSIRQREVTLKWIRDYYCSRKRPSLRTTAEKINAELTGKADGSTTTGAVSESTVRRALQMIDPYAVARARYGKPYADNRWRYSLKGIQATRALERVEIDHTLLDIVVICDTTGMPLGRPTITLVVDAYSGYVLGFFISFWGTGLAPTLAAIKQSILPKGEITSAISGLSHPWLAEGVHDAWYIDNGLEFHSPQFHLAAMELGCDLLFCPVRQPWFKPVVERAMLDIKMSLPAQGLVRRALTNELPLDPAKSACIRFSDLCFGLTKAFVDVHPFEINERRLCRPIDLFQESIAEIPPPAFPEDMRSFDLLGCVSKPMVVGNEGVVSQYLRYNSPALQTLRRRTGHTFKTTVKIEPGDLGGVHVQDRQSKQWLYVPSLLPEYTSGLSLVQHRAIRQHKKGALEHRGAEQILLRGKAELNEMWASAVRLGRQLLSKRQLLQLSTLTSANVFNGLSTSTARLAHDVERMPSDADFEVVKRQTPSFQTFQLE